MHYLVTGGAGFIGSHLCDALLEAGHTVRVVDDLSTGKVENLPSSVELIKASITEDGVWARVLDGIEGVFHLAAVASVERSRQEWAYTHAVNQSAFVSLLEALSRQEPRLPVVYASSAAVYGDNDQLPLTEDALAQPATAYGADKLGCDLHARVGALVHGIPTLGLRFFNVYGPRQDPGSPYSGVVSIFMERIPARRPITVFGDGKQTRDFIHVSDVVRALMAAMGTLQQGQVSHEVCHVCTGKQVSLLDLVRAIEAISAQQADVAYEDARTGDIRHSCGDASKLSSLLGVPAATTLEDGLHTILQEVRS